MSFDEPKFSILMKSSLPSFVFMACAFCDLSKKSLSTLSSQKNLFFFSRHFIALAFMFRSMAYIELIFIDD